MSERVWTCQGCGTTGVQTTHARLRKWCSERCRKSTLYGGVCEDCGGPTDGSAGLGKAATRCRGCIRWTREQAIEAVKDFAAEHGRAPRVADAETGGLGHGRLPRSGTAERLFGRWNELLVAAGQPVTCDRFAETQELIEGMIREGSTLADVAEVTGLSRDTIRMRLRYRGMHLRDLRPDYPRANLLPEQVRRIRELRAAGWTYAHIAEEVGCHLRTALKYSRDVLPAHTQRSAA